MQTIERCRSISIVRTPSIPLVPALEPAHVPACGWHGTVIITSSLTSILASVLHQSPSLTRTNGPQKWARREKEEEADRPLSTRTRNMSTLGSRGKGLGLRLVLPPRGNGRLQPTVAQPLPVPPGTQTQQPARSSPPNDGFTAPPASILDEILLDDLERQNPPLGKGSSGRVYKVIHRRTGKVNCQSHFPRGICMSYVALLFQKTPFAPRLQEC